MNIISDTNIFLAVALDEPEKEQIIQVTSGANIISPEILPYEIGNALSAMVKRKQLTPEEALQAQRKTNLIPVRLVSTDIQKALTLAIQEVSSAWVRILVSSEFFTAKTSDHSCRAVSNLVGMVLSFITLIILSRLKPFRKCSSQAMILLPH